MHRLTSTLLLGISFLIFFASATETRSWIGGKNERAFPATETANPDFDNESPIPALENHYNTIANEHNSTTQEIEKDSTSQQTTETVAETTDGKTTETVAETDRKTTETVAETTDGKTTEKVDQYTTVSDEPSSTVDDQTKYKNYTKTAQKPKSLIPMTIRNVVTKFSKVIEDFVNLLQFETKSMIVSSEIYFDSGCPFSFGGMEAANIITSPMRFGPVEEIDHDRILIHTDHYYNQLEAPVMYVGNYKTVDELEHFMLYDNFLNLSGPWLPLAADGLNTLTNWDIEDTYNILGHPIPQEKPFELLVRENFTIVLNWYLEKVRRSSNWEIDVILNGYFGTYFFENFMGTKIHVFPLSAFANKEFSPFGDGLRYTMKGELMALYGKRLSVEISTHEGSPRAYAKYRNMNGINL